MKLHGDKIATKSKRRCLLRAVARVSYNAREGKRKSPRLPCSLPRTTEGACRAARGGIAQFFRAGLADTVVAVRSRRSPFLRSPKDNSQEDSMKARRFVSRGTVVLVSFLLVASLAPTASRVASARRQAEQKTGQPKPDAQGVQQKTDQQKGEPTTQKPSERGDKSAPKASVPAANGRARSSSAD